jgi:hypothetical protein
MAYEISNYSVKVTLVAAADLSALQYTFVKLNASGQAAACSAATDIPIGVLQNAPTSGQEAEVLVVGGTKIVAGAAIGEGALVGTSSAGKAVALVAGTDTTKYVVGTLLTESAADGNIVTAVINCANPGRAA